MATKKGGLGRGLDSLFADTGSGVAQQSTENLALPLREIEPDKDQPRKMFDDQSLAELSKSIEDHGVLQPIVVRPNPTGGYIIVAGERRWRAARKAGLTEIPALVKDISATQAIELALIENLQREDLDPVEEALGYRQLMDRCNLTQEQAAEKVARSRSAVANSLRLLSLPPQVLEWLKSGELSTGHAKVILSLTEEEKQNDAATLILQDKLNVRQAEALVKRLQKEPKEKRASTARPSVAAEVEISLQQVLGTQVKVQYAEGKGTLSIGFCSEQQLRDFANLLGNYDPTHTIDSSLLA